MGLFELLNDGDVLGALFQTVAALGTLGGVVLAGNEPSVDGSGACVEVVNAEFVHEAKDSGYVHALFTR